MNFSPHKYFLNFPTNDLTASYSPTKVYLEFSSGDSNDIEMKEIVRRPIPSRDLSNLHFPPYFSCDSDFIASAKSSACRITITIPSLDQYVLMYNLIDGSGISNVGPDTMSLFIRSSKFWSSGLHRF